MKLKVGTRGSQLALAQTDLVIGAIRDALPEVQVERVIIRTEGDRRRRASLLAIGGQGVFTRELEVALLDGEIDVAVHSLKDLPSTLPEGLLLAATPRRADPRDLLVTRDGKPLWELPVGAVVGTGSLRRRAQLLAMRPDLQMADIRGNVDTRLAKLAEGEYDAIVLAAAGLERLGLSGGVGHTYLDPSDMVPAPAQGILGLECRGGDEKTRAILETVNEPGSYAEATAERALLRRFGIGCRLPLGALGRTEGGHLRLHARVLAPDGTLSFDAVLEGDTEEAEQLGAHAAERLVAQGALKLLDETAQAVRSEIVSPNPEPKLAPGRNA